MLFLKYSTIRIICYLLDRAVLHVKFNVSAAD